MNEYAHLTDDQLLDEVRDRLASDPLSLPRFMAVAMEGVKAWRDAERNSRDAAASAAVRTLMTAGSIKKTHRLLPFLIDPAFYQFPTGPSRHSQAELRFWEAFLATAKKEGTDPGWLKVKGARYVEWWDRVVKPHLGGGS